MFYFLAWWVVFAIKNMGVSSKSIYTSLSLEKLTWNEAKLLHGSADKFNIWSPSAKLKKTLLTKKLLLFSFLLWHHKSLINSRLPYLWETDILSLYLQLDVHTFHPKSDEPKICTNCDQPANYKYVRLIRMLRLKNTYLTFR